VAHLDETERSPRAVVRRLGQLARAGLPVLQLGTRRLLGDKSPFQVTFSLTNRCNFRCEYCDIPLQEREEMSTAEWCAAIDAFRAGGMGRASLIGGEPLLHDDVGVIIRHLKDRGVHTAMNTNGWLVPDRIDDVRLLDLVCLTLDGPPEIHDRQRRKGSYERVLRAFDALRSAGVPFVTMTVVTPSGAERVDHVLDVARAHGFKAFFQLEHDKGCDVMSPISPKLSRNQITDLAARLLRLKGEGAPVGNSKMVLEHQRDRGRYLGTCADCYAGMYYAYMLSDGTVAPCLLTQWQQEAGNGKKHGFLEAFHAMAAPEGPGCSCVPTHEVNRVLAFDPRALWHAVEVTLDTPPGG
jgi:MoaA/NifB/PqqE/SkfB family radical SAM enzyme